MRSLINTVAQPCFCTQYLSCHLDLLYWRSPCFNIVLSFRSICAQKSPSLTSSTTQILRLSVHSPKVQTLHWPNENDLPNCTSGRFINQCIKYKRTATKNILLLSESQRWAGGTRWEEIRSFHLIRVAQLDMDIHKIMFRLSNNPWCNLI